MHKIYYMTVDFKEIKDISKMILREQDVLLRKAKSLDKTSSGLYLPESAKKDMPQVSIVVKVGVDIKDLKEGDVVIGISLDKVPALLSNGVDYYVVQRHHVTFATSGDNYGEDIE